MEDEVVTQKDTEWLEYLLAQSRLNKDERKKKCAESGICLSPECLDADYKKAIEWFSTHPDFISPDIAYHF